jgi:diacylglycerol kinase family enzyme
MRAELIINPRATTTSARVIDVLVHAFADELDLHVTMTTHPGHAYKIGEQSRLDRTDLVITLGGDGVIHEVVNGLLTDGPGPDVPMLATIPGGSGNVFVRALGLPLDPVETAGEILESLREKSVRTIGLGRVHTDIGSRWFVANAGLGIDAEIIEAMEQQRAAGHTATPTRYLRTSLRQYLARTNRKHPALTITRAGGPPLEKVFLAIVQNTAPWTYFGRWPIDPCPQADFDAGLDLFALRGLGLPTALRAARRMIWSVPAGSTRRSIVVWHDQTTFTVTADRPIPLQTDGESAGRVRKAEFWSVPEALRTVAPPLANSDK